MIIPKATRIKVYRFLFSEGVLVTKKNPQGDFENLDGIPNLHVLMLMKSLVSREYVRNTFSWQYNYYYLTEEGINYLREYLALPATVAPQTKTAPAPQRPSGGFSREGRRGDRPAFRRRDDGYRSREGGFGRGGGRGRF